MDFKQASKKFWCKGAQILHEYTSKCLFASLDVIFNWYPVRFLPALGEGRHSE